MLTYVDGFCVGDPVLISPQVFIVTFFPLCKCPFISILIIDEVCTWRIYSNELFHCQDGKKKALWKYKIRPFLSVYITFLEGAA